jgi:hypothetical protein
MHVDQRASQACLADSKPVRPNAILALTELRVRQRKGSPCQSRRLRTWVAAFCVQTHLGSHQKLGQRF